MKKAVNLFFLLCLFTQRLMAQVVVDAELKDALKTNPVAQVIVTFYGDGAPQPSHLSLLQQVGITKGLTLKALPMAGVLATAAQVDALAQRPEIKSIFLNKRLTYYNFDGNSLTGVRRLRTDAEMTARNKGLPVSGKGVSVLVNDSGVDGTHDDLKFGSHLVQNVLGSTNLNAVSDLLPITYVEGVPNTDSNSGHGTHCAGTVGGTGAKSGGKYEGVAPGASLLGYGSGAALLVLDAIGGFDYALTHQFQYNIRVVSNSFGTSGAFNPAHPINVATKKLYDRNVVIVFAAGNEGPGADTHNPYAIAPWVISVGAGDKNGKLADFSSRGVKGQEGTFTMDGETWTFKNEPGIVAPGVDIISTRAIAPVSSLGAEQDVAELEPAHIPYYTHSSGTSMATPHVAGVVALMLEAKPTLTPAQVKDIIQKTATNMPGRQAWEVGAGYVNAYAAVDQAFRSSPFGATVNSTRRFTSSVNARSTVQNFSVNFNPLLTTGNQFTFPVEPGTNSLEAKIIAGGVSGETGNAINLILLDPTGQQYRSGIPVAFALYQDRSLAVVSPPAGTWTLRVEGLNGVALPETVRGSITFETVSGTTGLNDIAGHPAEASIKLAVSNRLVDGLNGVYKPEDALKRIHLADYLLMGQAIRQYLPTNGQKTVTDVTGTELLLAESVLTKGAALRDRSHVFNGVMLAGADGKFTPNGNVDRTALAYSLVQALGYQSFALERNGKPVTVTVDGKKIPIDDAAQIPAGFEGYVSLALDLNLINAFFSLTQGTFDLKPTLRATFKPKQVVTRAEFAVVVTRTFTQWETATTPTARAAAPEFQIKEAVAYPNPFVGSTTISYSLPQEGPVTVEVHDVMGRRIRTLVNEQKPAGDYQVNFDASALPSGNYMFNVTTPNGITAKRLVVK
ncbi:hypothetical protein GCM10023189_37080 [Nibrella saemangeumensis]|uniref:SLH domain-containing protein n=1 Tax=Nibrella saemangeumensis TaxID=1084526 RepID=A0ABP8N556_9BACT